MPTPTEAELFLADLADELFACYAVVGTARSKAWKMARRAITLIPQINIYRFDDYETLTPVIGDGKPVGVAFSRTGILTVKLNKQKAEDLDAVLRALEDALRVPV
ncbi:MAG: hypothetical protein KDE27_01370, partial [Planctomycetes bacterium]|nr:hypothetical protein [Planctomycetota bacterium]